MVIKDLYKVLQDRNEVPHGVSYPDLLKEIRKFKESNHENTKPTILIQFPQLVYTTHGSTTETLRGRPWGKVFAEWKSFFDALTEEDMQLVFFSESYQPPKDESKWLAHRTRFYMEECQTIEAIQRGQDISKHRTSGSALSVYRDYLEQNLKAYGKWVKVFDSDIALEMARYAKENHVFAVFSDSIDFLFHAGNYRLWCIRNIRFDTLSTREINKFNFRKALGLFPEQMPLFATLCGNSFSMPLEKLQSFHNSFPEKARVKGIAKYVTKVQDREEPVDIEKIARRVGCTNEEVEASLQKYDMTKKEPKPQHDEDSLEQKLRDCGNSHVYALCKMQVFRLGPYFEDLRSPILDVHQMDLSLQLYKKLLGILFKEKDDPNLKYPLYTIEDHEKGYQRIEYTPDYPSFEVPPIDQLMFDQKSDKIALVRLHLLKWCLKWDNISALEGVPDTFVPIILTLHTIVQEAKLKTDDADVILLSFHDTMFDRVPILPNKQPPLEVFPFQLSYYFLRIQSIIIRMLATIGFVKWSKCPEFNGIYFHHLYKAWKDMDDYAKNDRLIEIKNMRLYAAEPIDN